MCVLKREENPFKERNPSLFKLKQKFCIKTPPAKRAIGHDLA